MDRSLKFKINVQPFYDGRIEIETISPLTEKIMKEVIDTKERSVREALIALGWKPPA